MAAGAEGSILFWDLRTGAQAAVFDDTHSESVTQVLLPCFLHRAACLEQVMAAAVLTVICVLLVKHRHSQFLSRMVTSRPHCCFLLQCRADT